MGRADRAESVDWLDGLRQVSHAKHAEATDRLREHHEQGLHTVNTKPVHGLKAGWIGKKTTTSPGLMMNCSTRPACTLLCLFAPVLAGYTLHVHIDVLRWRTSSTTLLISSFHRKEIQVHASTNRRGGHWNQYVSGHEGTRHTICPQRCPARFNMLCPFNR